MKKFLTFVAVAMMFAACTNDDLPQTDRLKGTPIILRTNVAELVTRAITDDGRLVNTELGLFVTTANANNKYEATNMKWTGDENGNWTSTDGTLLYEGAGKQTAYAYSPYADDYDATNGTLTINLAEQTDYLYASSNGLTSNEISLDMLHRLSKVTVNITGIGTEIADDEISSIALANVPVVATWTLATNNLTNEATTGNILTDENYSALLLPGTISVTILVEMESGRIFMATATAPEGGFVGGKAYSIKLKVGHDGANIGDVRVAGWGNAVEIDGGVAADEKNTPEVVIAKFQHYFCDSDGKMAIHPVDESSHIWAVGITSGERACEIFSDITGLHVTAQESYTYSYQSEDGSVELRITGNLTADKNAVYATLYVTIPGYEDIDQIKIVTPEYLKQDNADTVIPIII